MVCMTNAATVRKFMEQLEAEGCECALDLEAGLATATDDGQRVYWALRKGAKGQPWIVRCTDSERIKFN